MRKNIAYIALAAVALTGSLAATSCSDERDLLSGEGTLVLTTQINSDVKRASRSYTEQDLAEKAIVWLSNAKGAVRKYNGLAEVPAGGIRLLADHYVAEVWTGDSVSASFDHKWYKGREEFDITNNNTTNVNIKCGVANSVVSVVYTDEADELISDYTMTVGHKRGELVFEGRDDRKGYFMMPSTDPNLNWNLEGNLANGTIYTNSGVIENAKPATEYVITVGYNHASSEVGGGYFTIEIDEHAIEVDEEVVITLAPQFQGYGFDMQDGLLGEPGKMSRQSVIISSVGNLTSAIIESPIFSSFLSGSDVDLFSMSDETAQSLIAHGLTHSYAYDADLDAGILKINFEPELLNALPEGEYPVSFTATDSYGKTTSASLMLTLSNAPVSLVDVVPADVWATTAVLNARILRADAVNPGISYRKVGTQAWTPATVTVNGDAVSASLSSLEPGTQYEFVATADAFTGKEIKSFMTEAAVQLPNAGFENWQDSSAPYLIYGAGESIFWDSGNHGSATMGKNVTVPSTAKKHSGDRSIQLNSQFVGVGFLGKFAAGNVFIGKYLDTLGTNGVLGWGRSFTSRPKAVKLWLHYTPVAIDNVDKSLPSEFGVSNGDMDQAIIYVAICDESTTTYNDNSFPVVVNTKTQEFFSSSDSNVIGYGELLLTSATEGDNMVQVTIPIEYFRKDIKASNIILTASASRYGDYFTGGAGSTLYLDDIELEY